MQQQAVLQLRARVLRRHPLRLLLPQRRRRAQ
jgi:hypothetical protein